MLKSGSCTRRKDDAVRDDPAEIDHAACRKKHTMASIEHFCDEFSEVLTARNALDNWKLDIIRAQRSTWSVEICFKQFISCGAPTTVDLWFWSHTAFPMFSVSQINWLGWKQCLCMHWTTIHVLYKPLCDKVLQSSTRLGCPNLHQRGMPATATKVYHLAQRAFPSHLKNAEYGSCLENNLYISGNVERWKKHCLLEDCQGMPSSNLHWSKCDEIKSPNKG